MKRVGMFLVSLTTCFGLYTCNVHAAPSVEPVGPEPVANDPSGAVATLKRIVDTLQPQVDTLYNFLDRHDNGNEWLKGASIGVYKPKSQGIPLGSIRAGYIGQDDAFHHARGWYVGSDADLPGLTKRYVPATIRGIATIGYLDALWKFAGKYGRLGGAAGHDADRETHILAGYFGVSGTW